MKQKIYPIDFFSGELIIPPSKSISQRVLACSLISDEKTVVKNFGESNDELTALEILKNSTKAVKTDKNRICIEKTSNLGFRTNELLFNESGLGARLFTPILATLNKQLKLIGKGSLVHRPMGVFDEIFPILGAKFSSRNGCLPFNLKGPIKPDSIEIDASLSSQFISGFIYAYVGSKDLRTETIQLNNPSSVPYLELSLEVLRNFGVDLLIENNCIQFNGPYHLHPCEITIESDWSSASFYIVAAALKGKLSLMGLNRFSNQADRKILDVIKEFGAKFQWKNNNLIVEKFKCESFNFDATHCPDLFPILAVLGSFGNSKSSIKGVHRLFSKESNRAKTITSEFAKLGAKIFIENDSMYILPAGKPTDLRVNSCKDHRIAMALAIFGSMLNEPIEISNSEAVNKSFPNFFKLLESLT